MQAQVLLFLFTAVFLMAYAYTYIVFRTTGNETAEWLGRIFKDLCRISISAFIISLFFLPKTAFKFPEPEPEKETKCTCEECTCP